MTLSARKVSDLCGLLVDSATQFWHAVSACRGFAVKEGKHGGNISENEYSYKIHRRNAKIADVRQHIAHIHPIYLPT